MLAPRTAPSRRSPRSSRTSPRARGSWGGWWETWRIYPSKYWGGGEGEHMSTANDAREREARHATQAGRPARAPPVSLRPHCCCPPVQRAQAEARAGTHAHCARYYSHTQAALSLCPRPQPAAQPNLLSIPQRRRRPNPGRRHHRRRRRPPLWPTSSWGTWRGAPPRSVFFGGRGGLHHPRKHARTHHTLRRCLALITLKQPKSKPLLYHLL